MLAKLLHRYVAEEGPLAEHVGRILVDHAVANGLVAEPRTVLNAPVIQRSIYHTFDGWWLSLPWWKTVWLFGSAERRYRAFVDHATQCGLLDHWAKRGIVGARTSAKRIRC